MYFCSEPVLDSICSVRNWFHRDSTNLLVHHQQQFHLTVVMSTSSQRDAVLSKVDKYRLVTNVTKKLTDIMYSVGHNEFLAKYGMLEELVQHWSANTMVSLAVATENEVPHVHTTLDTLPEPNNSTVQSGISAEFSSVVHD